MKKIYQAIQSRLLSLSESESEVKGNALKRINTLSGLVSGMIRKGSSHLSAIGSGLPQPINCSSKTKAAKRFVENKWTDVQMYSGIFYPFYKLLFKEYWYSPT